MHGCFYVVLIAWGCTAIKSAHRDTNTDVNNLLLGKAAVCVTPFSFTLYIPRSPNLINTVAMRENTVEAIILLSFSFSEQSDLCRN